MAKLRLLLVTLFETIFISTLLADNNITFKKNNPIQMIADKGVEIESSVPAKDIFFSFNGDKSASPTNMGPGSFSVVTTLGNSNVWFNGQNLFDLLKNIVPPTPPLIEKKYALFLIPVNLTTNGTFNGFELKASTNNFLKAGNPEAEPQYYSQSEIADMGSSTNTMVDRMWIFACTRATPNFDGDVRSYYWITNTMLFKSHLETVAVLVEQSCLERHPDGDWLRESNQDLMWSWSRHKSLENDASFERVWRPIMPIRWYERIPNWAWTQIPPFN